MRASTTRRGITVGLGLLLAGACSSRSGDEPSRQDILLPKEANVVEARVPRNATLETILRDNGVPSDLATTLIGSVRTVFNPRELRADQAYRISKTLDGLVKEFRYQIDADRILRAVRLEASDASAPVFNVEVVPLPKEFVAAAATIGISKEHPSLVGAFAAAGESFQLALDLADVFGGLVDFNSDLQDGDHAEVLFDRAMRYGEPAGYGPVRAAVLDLSDRRLVAIRFTNEDGKAAYYDETGRSLKRQFLPSPLPFEPRITSRFSYRRLHPVTGNVRAHLGVDYGAPTGTAVVSVAVGTVEFAGWNGDAGRMVKIRHAGGYQTLYLHLSGFAPGIRPGVRVGQGQLIGRVGMTGSATGPHLDYRIIKNGSYVNPLVEIRRMPPGEPISAKAMPAFEELRDQVLDDLAQRIAPPPPAAAGGQH